MNLVIGMATDNKGPIMPNTMGFHFYYFLFPELFLFSLIMKRRGLNILELGGRTVKEHHALLQLVIPALMHLDQIQ